MRWWMLGLAGLALIGCGREEPVAVRTKSEGPKVDISVEPLRWKAGPALAESSRAQKITAEVDQPLAEPPRRKRKKVKPKPKPPKEEDIFGELSEEERRRLIEGGI